MTAALARRFHDLHVEGPLMLPNAWDAGSARLAQAAGARAIATSSAAVAWSHGCADGNLLPAERLLETVRAIVGAVGLPVSVDIEAGYSSDPEAVGRLVGAVVQAGAVGINLEDGAGDPELLCRKIAAARRAADALGVPLYINARTDVYLRGLAGPGRQVDEVVARGRRYLAAGASGLFAPGVVTAEDIAGIVGAIAAPLNVMARPALVELAQLRALGVRRYSAGSAVAEAMHGLVSGMMREFLASGRIDGQGVTPLSWSALNGLMAC